MIVQGTHTALRAEPAILARTTTHEAPRKFLNKLFVFKICLGSLRRGDVSKGSSDFIRYNWFPRQEVLHNKNPTKAKCRVYRGRPNDSCKTQPGSLPSSIHHRVVTPKAESTESRKQGKQPGLWGFGREKRFHAVCSSFSCQAARPFGLLKGPKTECVALQHWKSGTNKAGSTDLCVPRSEPHRKGAQEWVRNPRNSPVDGVAVS